MPKLDVKSTSRPPAITPEIREQELIALAMDQAEQQLKDGTASSQTINHFLKMASENYQLQIEKLKKENELLKAKTEAIKSNESMEKLYKDAMDAMKLYSGSSVSDEFE